MFETSDTTVVIDRTQERKKNGKGKGKEEEGKGGEKYNLKMLRNTVLISVKNVNLWIYNNQSL